MVGEISGMDEFTDAVKEGRKLHIALSGLRNGLVVLGVAFVALACGIMAEEENPALSGDAVMWLGACSMLAGLLLSVGLAPKKVRK